MCDFLALFAEAVIVEMCFCVAQEGHLLLKDVMWDVDFVPVYDVKVSLEIGGSLDEFSVLAEFLLLLVQVEAVNDFLLFNLLVVQICLVVDVVNSKLDLTYALSSRGH